MSYPRRPARISERPLNHLPKQERARAAVQETREPGDAAAQGRVLGLEHLSPAQRKRFAARSETAAAPKRATSPGTSSAQIPAPLTLRRAQGAEKMGRELALEHMTPAQRERAEAILARRD